MASGDKSFQEFDRIAVLSSGLDHFGVAQRHQEAVVDQRRVAGLHGSVEDDAVLMDVWLLPMGNDAAEIGARDLTVGAEVESARRVGSGRIDLETRR